jgi:Zn-dependent protease
VVSIFYLIREGLRVRYSKKYSLITEHVFWPLGSILTFFSTILGNTFSLASYIALENEEKEKRYSRMYFTIFSILFGLTLLTFILNILVASEILQMFYTFTIMAVFIDMTPIQPMDGYEIKKHNMKRWIALYIPVFIVYIIIMFSTLL